ncbi:hypothetical protein INT48_008551 [Thamnidium elegans]|uniref:Uncharacterized protein n=1 Tax=Thamnidium elegans TaxID=101142 RepID=A0A8H7SSS2_9FUNG|nr:hypothetical protein INT48_008551 [Thamnidium elegans]
MDFEYLSFNEQDDSDELTGEVTVSLMSMMRAKYEYSPAAMEIDEDLTEEFSHNETDSTEKQTNKHSVEEGNSISEHDIKSRIENFVSTLAKEKTLEEKL